MPMLLMSLILAQDPQIDAGAIVSKMINRYHGAKTLSGEFTSSVLIGKDKATITTKFQLERPAKLYLKQSVSPGNRVFIVTSDGKEFSYMKPLDTPLSDRNRNGRLLEDVTPATRMTDIVRASAQSIAERSAVLDLMVSDIEDLKFLRDEWQTVTCTGKVDLNGEQVYRIVGKWRLDAKSPSTANYGMYVTEAGDLKKYVIDGTFALDNADPNGSPIQVEVTREVVADVKVDEAVDQQLFTVLKS